MYCASKKRVWNNCAIIKNFTFSDAEFYEDYNGIKIAM